MKKYKLFSILVIVILFVLMNVGCDKTPSGKLSIKVIDSNTLDVGYSFSGVLGILAGSPTYYYVYLNGVIVSSGSSSGSGVKRYSNLQPNTSYNFTLRTANQTLATVTGTTKSK